MARLVPTQPTVLTGAQSPRRTVVISEAPGAERLRLRAIAGRAGFHVMSASSGRMVGTVARRSVPDLVVLTPETGPPGPSEIARGIKENPETRDIPVMYVIEAARFAEVAPLAYPMEALIPDDASDDEILKTMRMLTVRAPRVRYAKKSSAPLEGDLKSDTFPEVLQYLFVTAKTGRIDLTLGRKRGTICIESGIVVHAELGDVEGLPAFRRMCFSQQGWFKFEPGAPAPRRTMEDDGIGLLLEAARQKDLFDHAKECPKPARRTAPKELFVVGEEGSSRGSVATAAGIAVLVAVLLLAALGVYAWSAI